MSHRILSMLVAGVLAAAFLFIAPTVRAQILYGSLVGTVADQSGAPIPGSPVTITNSATGVSREAITDEASRYSILNILPGRYTLRVSAPAFRTFERPGVDIAINAVARIDVRLEVGGMSETVTVSATAALRQTWYYDPASFADPNFKRPANVYRFGNMGPNSLRGPGFWRMDIGMFKTFGLTEGLQMEFKAEAFNLTNTPRFANPAGNVSNMKFNDDGSIQTVNNFMAIPGREGRAADSLWCTVRFLIATVARG